MTQALSVIQPVLACHEHELVAAVRAGSDAAFAELHDRYRRRIETYLSGQLRDHARAEDVTQEVFLSALRRLRSSEQPIALRPWLFEIARNACIDEYRRTRRAREVALDGDDETPLPGCGPAPEVAVEHKQALADLRDALFGLSDAHHKLIVMRDLEGRSYNEIGARLGMSRATVESSLFRARRRLEQEYSELSSGRRCVRVQTAIDEAGERALRKLGIRERRQLSRHLAHCQPCRRHAWQAGLDPAELAPRSLPGKIAALLPLPGLWVRRLIPSSRPAAPTEMRLPVPRLPGRVAPKVSQLQDPTSGSVLLSRAATAAAAAAIGIGGGSAVVGSSHHAAPTPAVAAAPQAALVASVVVAPPRRNPVTSASGHPGAPASSASRPRRPGLVSAGREPATPHRASGIRQPARASTRLAAGAPAQPTAGTRSQLPPGGSPARQASPQRSRPQILRVTGPHATQAVRQIADEVVGQAAASVEAPVAAVSAVASTVQAEASQLPVVRTVGQLVNSPGSR